MVVGLYTSLVSLLENCGKTLVPNQNAPVRGIIYLDGKGNSSAGTCEMKMNTIDDNQQISFRLMV